MHSKPQAFDPVAEDYQQKALVQHQAAKKLLSLLPLKGDEDVLDAACGPGHITDALRSMTRGRVAGMDISEGMIAAARSQHPRLEFFCGDVHAMPFNGEFDLVFCNSALQWFRQPAEALQALRRALRPEGRLGVSCPAAWPTFEDWVQSAVQDPDLAPVFAHWRNPWFTLPDLNAYTSWLEGAGFSTLHAEWADETMHLHPERAFQVYLSGAGNGYTGAQYYDLAVTEAYRERFQKQIRRVISERTRENRVTVVFKRLFFIGKKNERS